ncbi:vanadium-dependent haloperoxidase [uncultured Thiohalocapsa sp.]|uniref:vanadium-dependent haloperoxidase n=1 Tax=uncultured Thiohalocapsa sp. TaxID=768990 RepID=UPI0025D684C3|nr:vanadium-dependent haloperoxidase [uncultured Thiohalocapsa sp.]
MTDYRREGAYQLRLSAARKAKDREHPPHQANGDEQRWAGANYAMCFTKGLHHDPGTGLLQVKADFERFRRAIDEGFIDAFTAGVRASPEKARAWEAPTAGVVYDLQGPDAQAVTMPPAPALGSDELAYEMAEVYELALLRDVPLPELRAGATDPAVTAAVGRLDALTYAQDGFPGRPRTTEGGSVTARTLFRGSSPGVEVGPYLSQFMLIGNDQPEPGGSGVADGYIQYGPLRIDQRVPVAETQDYMTDWGDWLAVQNGADVRNNADLFSGAPRRFITTPRDLATYVHDDALYQAYLNACLILLSMEAPFDPGFGHLSGQSPFFLNSLDATGVLADILETHPSAAGGFALYGGPHILTLVTEVATRALKAVRYQKFNTHIRLRPETLAGRIHRAAEIQTAFPQVGTVFEDLEGAIQDTVNAIRAANGSGSALLPMAFQEGSPMHPAYGAGHATVAGACVTILKAYFDTNAVFVRRDARDRFALYENGDTAVHYEPETTPGSLGASLDERLDGDFLTLEGELNKLAANISIGRNMAGVHYYSDYYDSLRMGERIAIAMLEEQALCYPTDPFVLTVPTFDGDVVRIGAR